MPTDFVTLGTTSGGAHARATPDEPVAVPLDELRDARGLVAGAPDSGIDGAAARIATALHDTGQSVLLVDPDGRHEEFGRGPDVRRVGDDAECDVRVTARDADRIAAMATEGDESVALCCDSFGPNEEATTVVGRIVAALGRTRRTHQSPIVVLADCHEWLPDAGQSACAEALRDVDPETTPGVGVVGVTDRPGAVDAGYRRRCDWIAVHRVSWREHVDAVTRILGRGYEDALESLEDGEAFLSGPWMEAVERVRFDPRPEPNGMADTSHGRHAVGGTVDRSRQRPGTDVVDDVAALSDDVAELRSQLDDLEATVEERDDVTGIAEELADAIVDRLDERAVPATSGSESTNSTGTNPSQGDAIAASASGENEAGDRTVEQSDGPDGFGDVFDAFDDAGSDSSAGSAAVATDQATVPTDTAETGRTTDATANGTDRDNSGMSFEPVDFAFDDGASGGAASPGDFSAKRSRTTEGERRVPRYVRDLVRSVEEMDPTTRQMLAHYVDRGADTPLNAHFSAGGDGDRTAAYAHNRQLRTTGFVEHVGRGHYAPTIPEKVRETAGRELSTDEVSKAAEHVRRALP